MKSKILKIVALFMAINILNITIAPTISYALTAGPTAPEYSSFEPVDTTDMVNLATGDFTYNIPLLQVPGPDGNYPISLSYHAGLEPSEEASWVGLGWTLNAGSINRYVNGYADDFNAVTRSIHDYWAGGESHAFTVGAGFYDGTNLGLVFSSDTYKGFGVGMSVSKGIEFGALSVGVGSTIGTSGSDMSLDASIGGKEGLGKALGQLKGEVGFELSVTDGSVSPQANVGLGNLKADLTSDNLKAGLTVAGVGIKNVNNKSGIVSSISKGFVMPIPTPYFIGKLGYKYQRYWIDQTENLRTFGTLNIGNSYTFYTQGNYYFSSLNVLDSYPMVDPDQSGVLSSQKPEYAMGGSFPAYDNYVVSGQGIGGTIQPYIFENIYLHRQNLYNQGENEVTFQKSNQQYSASRVSFRFNNDFSNSLEMDIPNYPTYDQMSNTFGNVPDETRTVNTNGFNTSKNHLAGSKHVEWFTNTQIQSGEAKNSYNFLSYEIDHTQRELVKFSNNVHDQIGGFMVTNSDGVTYHYSLPVYAYDEYSKFQVKSSSGTKYRTHSNAQPYAYTWLLTAITGADYVDRGNPGISDDDYGYYVKFSYGKWTDNYQWRNPENGVHEDLDPDKTYYSYGKKELYFLDAIKTRSYTALFVKDIRTDGKGIANLAVGGFNPVQVSSPSGNYYTYPTSNLRLNKIYLVSNTDLTSVLQNGINSTSLNDFKANGQTYSQTFDYGNGNVISIPHYGDNVLDVSDINGLQGITDKAIKVVSFNTDYTICPNTDNSIENDIYVQNPSTTNAKKGKLTLKSIEIGGKGNRRIIPSVKFDYGYGNNPADLVNNPTFDRDKRDVWGMYKSDYVDLGDDNLSRSVSDVSASKVDAWSLKKITTPSGAIVNVEYESDDYNNPALAVNNSLTIKSIIPQSGNNVKIEINEGVDLTTFSKLQPGKSIRLLGLLKHKGYPTGNACIIEDISYSVYHVWQNLDYTNTIQSVGSNYIIINNADLITEVNKILYNLNLDCASGVLGQTGSTYAFLNKPVFVGGNIIFEKGDLLKGGGLRVKSISTEMEEDKFVTTYEYLNGTTSYEPMGLNKTVFDQNEVGSPNLAKLLMKLENEALDIFKGRLYSNFSTIILNSRELPPPGVIYAAVRVKDKTVNKSTNIVREHPNYNVYEFSVYDNTMNTASVEMQHSKWGNKYGTVVLRNYTSRIGSLEKITLYDSADNMIEGVENIYLNGQVSDNNSFRNTLENNYNNQGRVDQLFHEIKHVGENNFPVFVYSKKEEYPSVLIQQVKTNYKNTGIKETSTNLEFDFYTGRPIKTLRKNSYGSSFISETYPAYRKYPAMGLKVNNPANKNMLEQAYLEYDYKVTSESDYTPVALRSASVTSWSNTKDVVSAGTQSSIWRPDANYLWTGNQAMLRADGLYDYGYFNSGLAALKNTTATPNSYWAKISENTLFDPYSHVLESKDINDNFSSALTDPSNLNMTTNVTNASYHEIAYSGAEYYSTGVTVDGKVLIQDGIKSSDIAHTGLFSLRVDPGKKGFVTILDKTKIDNTRKYRASAWVYMPGFTEDELNMVSVYCKIGASETVQHPQILKKAGSFYLINFIFQPDGINNVEVGCKNETANSRPVYFDDFRVCPLTSIMSNFIYDPATLELIATLNNDNFYMRYKYDSNGRLTDTYQEILYYTTEKRLSNTKYNYKRKD